MAKESGMGITTLTVDNSSSSPKAIKNDITNFAYSTPRGVQDVTGVDKSAMERLLLLADASLDLNGVFNKETDMSHDIFKTVPSTSVARLVTLVVSGQTLAPTLLFSDYALNRAADGSLTWVAPGALAGGAVPTWTT